MNRIALSLTLALGLAAGLPASADGPALSADFRASTPPDWFAEVPEGASTPVGDLIEETSSIVVKGRRSYSEERALADARSLLEATVAEWLSSDLPGSWPLPEDLVDALIVDRHVEPVLLDLDRLGLLVDDPGAGLPEVLYIGAIQADLSPDRREAFLDVHRRQVGAQRLALLGGVGGFVLSCLAILSLYIRADEATRGYYTNRLRLVALASAGAAGVILYRLVS